MAQNSVSTSAWAWVMIWDLKLAKGTWLRASEARAECERLLAQIAISAERI